MRKMIIVAALAVMILMGSIASANPARLEWPDIVIVPDNSVRDYQLKVYDLGIGGDRTISVKTSESTLEAKIAGQGIDTGWTSTTRAVATWTAPDPVSTSEEFFFTLSVRGTTAGIITISDNAGNVLQLNDPDEYTTYDVAVETDRVDIPEFPTVALPVAAILGLAFLFQRRKEE